MKRASQDNDITLREFFEVRFDSIEAKIEEWKKEYVTKLQLREAIDEFRHDIHKDLSDRRRLVDENLVAIKSDVVQLKKNVQPAIEDLADRKKDRRRLFWLVVGTMTSAIASLLVALLRL